MESNVPNKKNGVVSTSSTSPKKLARVIRTMKDDVRDAIEQQHETTVTIAMAEKKKNALNTPSIEPRAISTSEAVVPSAPRPIGRIIVIVASIAIVALLGAAYVFLLPKIKAINFKLPSISIHLPSFGRQSTTTQPEPMTIALPLAPSIIPADFEKRIDTTSKTWSQVSPEIAEVTKQDLASKFITNIYFFETTASSTSAISATRFLALSNSATPEILTRSLEASLMVGLLGEDKNKATPFIVLKISEHSAGLAGILAWETELPFVFDSVFGTTIKDNMTPISKFHNVVVGGKDIRTLSIKSGNTISYAFADENTIIIAGSQSALETLISLATLAVKK